MGPRSTWKIVVGIIMVVLGLPLLIGGLAVAVVFGTDGRVTGDGTVETTTSALTTRPVDIGDVPFDRSSNVELQLRLSSTTDVPVFIGVGPEADVAAYLEGVATERVDNVSFDPFSIDGTIVEGDRVPDPPAAQTFWVTQVEGSGEQTLDWEIESGTFQVVIMNADGSPNVSVDGRFGLRIPWIFPVGIVILVIGALLLIGGILLIVFGARRRPLPAGASSFDAPPAAGQPPPPPPAAGQSPPPPPPPTTTP